MSSIHVTFFDVQIEFAPGFAGLARRVRSPHRSMTGSYAPGMTIQIAVKLPDRLVNEIDRLVDGGAFDSRSQAIRSGLEAMVADRRRQEVDRRYAEAMARHPETNEEMADATRLAVESIHEEPWERWW